MAFSPTIQETAHHASILRALHQPGNPLILANTYSPLSTSLILSLNTSSHAPVKVIATTSNGIASLLSIPDADLSLSQNLAAHADLAPLVRAAGLPMSMDLQDGYGEELEDAVRAVVEIGIVGVNIEDGITNAEWGGGFGCLRSAEEMSERVGRAMKVAREMGVEDFVVNARCDILRLDPEPEGWTREMLVQESVRRGKMYLGAGATCIFVWGGEVNISDEEVRIFVGAFAGRVAVRLAPRKGGLSVDELRKLGVCRISVGGGLQGGDMEVLKETAGRVLGGGRLCDDEV